VTVTGPSFRKSAENLERLGQIRVSSNRLRQIVEDEGPAAMLVRIHETRRLLRSSVKREELRKLEHYVAKRVDMLDYPTFREAGFELGSGPTEAFCKTLTARLKGSGMRWDSPNAEGIMALAAMDQSGQWQTYWNLQNAIAA